MRCGAAKLGAMAATFGWTEAARDRLKARFADHGVVRVEYAGALIQPVDEPRPVSVTLGTGTDAQRDKLAALPHLLEAVADVLRQAGMGDSERLDGVSVQSEETVRRDYDGSWFYAMR